MSDGLKPGWRRVRFGEVVHLNKDTSKNPEADGLDRYVGLEHLEPGDLRIWSWGNIADGTTFTNRFRAGQVLFGKRRAYQRKVAVADFDGICSGDIYVLESKDPSVLLPELLPFICQTDGFFEYAIGTSAGSLSPRTNWKSLADYEFALPPLNKQQQIIRNFTELYRTRDAYVLAHRSIDQVRRSLLLDWFRPDKGTRDRFPKTWKKYPFSEVGDTQIGIRKHPGNIDGPDMRKYLRVANVLDGYIDWSKIKSISVSSGDKERCALKDGDILINKGNSLDLVGRTAVFRTTTTETIYFQDHLLRFRPNEILLPDFANAFIQHLFYTFQFMRVAVISTTIATIPTKEFLRMRIPVPPLGQQELMVEQLRSVQKGLRKTQERISMLSGVSRALKGAELEA